MATGSFKIGALDVNDLNNYAVSSVKLPVVPVQLTIGQLAMMEGSIVAFERFPHSTASIEGFLGADTEVAAQALLDAFNNALRGEMELRLGFTDERYWRVRLESIEWEYINPLGFSYAADFVAVKPFAYANTAATDVTNNSALSSVGGGEYTKNIVVPVAGSAYNWPVITITVPAGGPYGMTYLSLTNAATSQSIARTHAYLANDVIVIDCENQRITINGTLVDYSGQFLYLEPAAGSNTLILSVAATSTPTLNVTVAYRNRYR